ncbi:MAG: heparinase II/III family protein [Phycisphaeraceae bacterium JB051]
MSSAQAQTDESSLNLPKTLPAHPRLMLTPSVKARVAKLLETDAKAQQFFQRIHQGAKLIARTPPIVRKLEGDKRKRMLDSARLALHNIVTMGVSHAFAPDDTMRDRIIAEILSAVNFVDWHPSHFLDTSEMALAVSLGYDWLYDELTEEQRQTIRDGIIRLGLEAALTNTGGLTWENNWNQVRHGSLSAAALAVYEDQPELAKEILQQAYDHFHRALHAYHGDGVYPEGPVYWHYGTSFSWVMAACLNSALGDDWGILSSPGFTESFEYVKQVTTPTGLLFNYADCNRGPIDQPIHIWAGAMLDRPDYIQFGIDSMSRYFKHVRVRGPRLTPLALLWYHPTENLKPTHGPTCYVGEGEKVKIATIRSAWDDPEASFIGIKGGHIRVNHGHMDIGSFIIEADGVRWAEDFGMEREIYDRKDSWGTDQHAHRWSFLRANNMGHNTLTLGGKLQDVDGMNPVIAHGQNDAMQFAVLDMSNAYAGQTTSLKRGIAIRHDKSMILQDDWTGMAADHDLLWTMITMADEIRLSDDKQHATLHEHGKTMHVSIRQGAKATFHVRDATPATEAEEPNKGYQRLLIRIPQPEADGSLIVHFVPSSVDSPTSLKPIKIDQWQASPTP